METNFIPQAEEIKIKTWNQGFCYKCFLDFVFNFFTLLSDKHPSSLAAHNSDEHPSSMAAYNDKHPSSLAAHNSDKHPSSLAAHNNDNHPSSLAAHNNDKHPSSLAARNNDSIQAHWLPATMTVSQLTGCPQQ